MGVGCLGVVLDRRGGPADPRLLRRLLQAHGGAASPRLACAGGVALGVVPGGRRRGSPVLLCPDAAGVSLVWDGRLDDRDRLLATLGSGVPPGLSDAELARLAYERRGSRFVERLVGDFAFVLWDERSRSLLAARDPIGIRPLHLSEVDGCLLLASTVNQLLCIPGISQVLNDGIVGEYLSGSLGDPEETFFRSIRRLRPGHLLHATPREVRSQRYWRPEAARLLRYRREAEYAEHLREVLRAAVTAHTRDAGRLGIWLSGGIDSSSVAALLPPAGGERPVAFTVVFDGLREADERAHAAAVAERLGLHAVLVAGDDCWAFKPAPDHAPGIPAWDEPLGEAHDVVIRALLARAQALGVDTVLTGDGADLLLTGSLYYLFDLLLALRLRRFADEVRCIPAAERRRTLWRYAIRPFSIAFPRPHEPRWVPDWVAPGLLRAIDLPARRRAQRLRRGVRRPSRHRDLESICTAHLGVTLPWDQHEGLRHGVELRHPFFDVRVIEALLGTPGPLKIERGAPKALLRHAMADVLPPRVRDRQHHGRFDLLVDRGLADRERARCLACLEDPLLAAHGYVDAARLRDAYRRYLGGERELNYALARTLNLELWLRGRAGLPPPGVGEPAR